MAFDSLIDKILFYIFLAIIFVSSLADIAYKIGLKIGKLLMAI